MVNDEIKFHCNTSMQWNRFEIWPVQNIKCALCETECVFIRFERFGQYTNQTYVVLKSKEEEKPVFWAVKMLVTSNRYWCSRHWVICICIVHGGARCSTLYWQGAWVCIYLMVRGRWKLYKMYGLLKCHSKEGEYHETVTFGPIVKTVSVLRSNKEITTFTHNLSCTIYMFCVNLFIKAKDLQFSTNWDLLNDATDDN